MSPHNKGWLYPPTRREVTLVLFSLTVFILSFNLQASLQLVGVKPAKLSGSYLSAIGLGAQDPGYDRNGRRPKEWRDALENMISGEWEWEEGKVAAVASTTAAGPVGTAAIYNAEAGKGPGRGAGNAHGGIGVSNGVSPRQQLVRWENEVPIARAVTHVPGFSILDNVIMANGTFYLVTDDPSSLPALEYIASLSTNSERPPRENEWEIVSTADAVGKLGTFGGRVYGTSWLALDHAESQDPYTLFSMFRTHSTLAAPTLPPSFSSDSSSQSRNGSLANVPAPLRLIFPNVPTFSSPHIPLAPGVDPKTHTEPRIKSYVARVGGALRRAPHEGRLVGAVRNALLGYLHLPELQEAASSKVSFWSKKPAAGKPVVTYVSMQDEPMGAGPRLNNDNHAALVAGLQSLQRDGVVSEVHVVKGNGSVGVHGWEWADRMSAIARSSIVLGPYGYQLADSLFMSPPAWQGREIASVSSTAAGEPEQSAAPLLMEFFPPGTFVRDQEFAVRSLGMRYIAWWNDRKFTSDDLPPVFQATGPSQRIPVSANAVMQVIRDEIARRTVP
ncbi:hypothetical protein EVJ58_g2103 [Rhodofomes roseus]|uniref:Uncharacterized protein n=1 Tax=Rhodofomes roseus TaxID=34475 RepID=A0A4Y9YUI9_9APHY|nr:hypothetical protein EVJ58_g2103 [Rhodofomes roseus]